MFTNLLATARRRAMTVNVGIFCSARGKLPVMKAQRSDAILSTAFDGNPPMSHDVPSKAAMLGLTRGMARKLGPHGIGVNNAAPCCTSSEGMLANATQLRRGRQENINEAVVKRDMIQGDVVRAALSLCGPKASFITGHTPVVNARPILH